MSNEATTIRDNPLAQFLEQRAALRDDLVPDVTLAPEPPLSPLHWQVQACAPPERSLQHVTLPQARETIRKEIEDYLAMDAPEHMLLVKPMPGTGKTTEGVRTAEACAARGRRVAYAGPRHDFFADLMRITRKPAWWYEWQPRQEGDEKKLHTCNYVPKMEQWLNKGYKGIDFCKNVCGYDYINNTCPWHAQKRRTEPIMFLQHAHVALGHPLDFSIFIGDEDPTQAFLWPWDIPARNVMLRGLEPDDPLTEQLHLLQSLCESDGDTRGPDLLKALGGADYVKQVFADSNFPASLIEVPRFRNSEAVDKVDYAFLPYLADLLVREAEEAVAGRQYIERVIAGRGQLTLLLRHRAKQLPPHVIWFDATGNEHIYAELFGRAVKVVEPPMALKGEIIIVTDRANGKSQLMDRAGAASAKFDDDARRVVERVIADGDFRSPGIVTFKSLLSSDWLKDMLAANFYGARGTNRLEESDIGFVVGAPLPPLSHIQRSAAMIYFKRMRPFISPWSVRWIKYDFIDTEGQGRMRPVGGYWADPDLQALVWQYREAEILQAAHRFRPLHRKVTVYLLVNVPIAELPVSQVVTTRDILSVPEDAEIDLWLRFIAWVDGRESVTAQEIVDGFGLAINTAKKYRDALAAMPGWDVGAVKTRTKPSKAAIRKSEIRSLTV